MAAFEDIPMGMVAKAAELDSPVEACGADSNRAADVLTDSERALVYVFRLVRQANHGGTVSPIDRAFIEGAKVTFELLSKQCDNVVSMEQNVKAALASPTDRPAPARSQASAPRKKRDK